MTHDALTGPADNSWDQDLARALTVLLGRPVDNFTTEPGYVLYYRNSVAVDGAPRLFGILGDPGSLRQAWLPDDATGRPELLEMCLSPDWGLDLAGSMFLFEFTGESALARAFGVRPDSNRVADAFWTVSGHDLATTLSAHDLAPTDIVAGVEDGLFTVESTFRVVTDGTLRDAVLTAIRAKRGPGGLRPGPDEAALLPLVPSLFGDDQEDLPPVVAAERDRLLAPIRDPRLRAHLWSPYLDRPWDRAADGSAMSTSDVPPGWKFLAARPGTTFVAAWDLAYFGEVSLAVMHAGDATRSALL